MTVKNNNKFLNKKLKYFLEKWYYMRKFFEAEYLSQDILRINDEFRIKWATHKRKKYYNKNVEKIREKNG